MRPGCPFCDEARKLGLPSRNPQAGHEMFALAPLNPVTEGHTLVIPVQHVEDALVDPAVTADAMRAAVWQARHLIGFLGVTDFNFITSVGAQATQTVKHLHIHIVPRRAGDRLTLPWTGQVKS